MADYPGNGVELYHYSKDVKRNAMITKEQYEAAKKIVEEYEYDEYEQYMMDADDDYDDRGDDDEEDDRDMEDFERACACTCGAWKLGKDGRGYHVADCYCGAE